MVGQLDAVELILQRHHFQTTIGKLLVQKSIL